ncbi:hypothetical protein CYMTET_6424 [Cymbomonas tetramitiformis]|uniref:Uncharacterized protein n=1 Tax=Cymbomonas tetramitiformis TaxID=36881 RepID=A0AAE0LI18_9CHLO|nr:hypothetical protein CYMTET_6424 [Cymbomonas tetramitiformis]
MNIGQGWEEKTHLHWSRAGVGVTTGSWEVDGGGLLGITTWVSLWCMSGAESRLPGLRPGRDCGWPLLHLWVAAAGLAGCPDGQQAEAAEWLGPAAVPAGGGQLEVLCAAGRAAEVVSGEVVQRRCRRN